jgi:hypothetical protein
MLSTGSMSFHLQCGSKCCSIFDLRALNIGRYDAMTSFVKSTLHSESRQTGEQSRDDLDDYLIVANVWQNYPVQSGLIGSSPASDSSVSD